MIQLVPPPGYIVLILDTLHIINEEFLLATVHLTYRLHDSDWLAPFVTDASCATYNSSW